MKTIQIPQIDGSLRVIAVSDADASRVRGDRTLVDCVDVLGAVDVYDGGRLRVYGRVGPRTPAPSVVDLLRASLSASVEVSP